MSKNKKGVFFGYFAVIAVGIGVALFVYNKTTNDFASAIEHYKKESLNSAEVATQKINNSFKLLFQGIRTISFLPSVKNIDRHGTNLDANARAAIVEIYKNMVSNVAVSEIYIVPVDLEPEQIDTVTGELQVPILMYDGNEPDPSKPEEKKPPITSVEQALKVSEVEIYEYRLLKEHMAFYKKKYGNQKLLDGIKLPMISGSQVLTCDNDEYKNTHNDADRTGLVFSVPFYGIDGQLKGTIAAIIRNNAIREMMPESNAALINQAYQYTLFPNKEGQEKLSEAWVSKAEPDPSLYFSTVRSTEIPDPRSQWNLWIGLPNTNFLESTDAVSIRNFGYFGYAASLAIALVGCCVWYVLQRGFSMMEKNNQALEHKVHERTAEIEDLAKQQEQQKAEIEAQKRAAMNVMADNFENSVKQVVTQVAASVVEMQASADGVAQIANDTKRRSAEIVALSTEAASTSMQVSAAAEELTASIKEISAQTQKSSQVASDAAQKAEVAKKAIDYLAEKSTKVSDIISVITSIAGQINLLALNATIESARAGEAGKGFAVVANEVKNLATQVSKATDDITQQIQEMQSSTTTSVSSVMDILTIIQQVNSSTAAVAAAVEEQSAVTNEIARNISQTAEGTKNISRNMSTVEQGAEETGKTAVEVREAAKNLAGQSQQLSHKVEEFLHTVRAS